MEAPLSALGADATAFEQSLFYVGLEDTLDNLDCSRYGGYIDRIFVDIGDDEEDSMVLQVTCDSKTSWVFFEGMPPEQVKTYEYKPVDALEF